MSLLFTTPRQIAFLRQPHCIGGGCGCPLSFLNCKILLMFAIENHFSLAKLFPSPQISVYHFPCPYFGQGHQRCLVYGCVCPFVHTCVCTYTHVCVYIIVCVHVHAYVYVCAYGYVCMDVNALCLSTDQIISLQW